MSVHDWYNSLFVKAYPPAVQFAKGALHGAGLPASVDEARGMADTALGTVFGIPGAYDAVGKGIGQTVEGAGFAVSHPRETAAVALDAMKTNPAGAAGTLLGMTAPGFMGGADEVRRMLSEKEALQFGGNALKAAGRRANARVLAERARVHAGLEGKTGPLPAIVIGPESGLDSIRNAPDKLLLRASSQLRSIDPKYAAIIEQEMARRGLKTDISDELHLLHEGDVGAINAMLPGPGKTAIPAVPIWTREERGQQMLDKANLQPTGTTANQAASRLLTQAYPDHPIGSSMALNGERWVNGPKGWMTIPGAKILPKDLDWIFKEQFDKTYPGNVEAGGLSDTALLDVPEIRESNIERAVELVAHHGGLNDMKARTVVAKRISDRMKSGQATTQEVVWYNMHRMGGFNPGGFKWHQ